MTINEIQDLIKFIAKAGVTEVEIEKQDFKITIKSPLPKRKGEAAQGEALMQVPLSMAPVMHAPHAPQPAAIAAVAEQSAEEKQLENYITVKSPMIGTFYRRSAPDKDAFVEVGQSIKVGDVLCVIEAMKLFNEIESEMTGKLSRFWSMTTHL